MAVAKLNYSQNARLLIMHVLQTFHLLISFGGSGGSGGGAAGKAPNVERRGKTNEQQNEINERSRGNAGCINETEAGLWKRRREDAWTRPFEAIRGHSKVGWGRVAVQPDVPQQRCVDAASLAQMWGAERLPPCWH